MMLKIVDLPQPLGPKMLMKRPRGMDSDNGKSACTAVLRSSSKTLETSLMSNTTDSL
jgi:hypothetical protein